jgi:hypothetical protein
MLVYTNMKLASTKASTLQQTATRHNLDTKTDWPTERQS